MGAFKVKPYSLFGVIRRIGTLGNQVVNVSSNTLMPIPMLTQETQNLVIHSPSCTPCEPSPM